MRTTPEIQAKLHARLSEAVERAGSADALGRALGWTNGGYVRQCLRRVRNVTPEFMHRANESSEEWLHGWFDGLLPPIAALDVAQAATRRAIKSAWPFKRLTQEQWDALGTVGQAIVEDVALMKARDLLAEGVHTAHVRPSKQAPKPQAANAEPSPGGYFVSTERLSKVLQAAEPPAGYEVTEDGKARAALVKQTVSRLGLPAVSVDHKARERQSS
jgi:hypothetical protein